MATGNAKPMTELPKTCNSNGLSLFNQTNSSQTGLSAADEILLCDRLTVDAPGRTIATPFPSFSGVEGDLLQPFKRQILRQHVGDDKRIGQFFSISAG